MHNPLKGLMDKVLEKGGSSTGITHGELVKTVSETYELDEGTVQHIFSDTFIDPLSAKFIAHSLSIAQPYRARLVEEIDPALLEKSGHFVKTDDADTTNNISVATLMLALQVIYKESFETIAAGLYLEQEFEAILDTIKQLKKRMKDEVGTGEPGDLSHEVLAVQLANTGFTNDVVKELGEDVSQRYAERINDDADRLIALIKPYHKIMGSKNRPLIAGLPAAIKKTAKDTDESPAVTVNYMALARFCDMDRRIFAPVFSAETIAKQEEGYNKWFSKRQKAMQAEQDRKERRLKRTKKSAETNPATENAKKIVDRKDTLTKKLKALGSEYEQTLTQVDKLETVRSGQHQSLSEMKSELKDLWFKCRGKEHRTVRDKIEGMGFNATPAFQTALTTVYAGFKAEDFLNHGLVDPDEELISLAQDVADLSQKLAEAKLSAAVLESNIESGQKLTNYMAREQDYIAAALG